jgi:hypothetical protein
MCVMCQMSLLEDHEEPEGPLCANCKRYRLGRQPMQDICYHCFNKNVGEECPVCALDIPQVFYDFDMKEELARMRAIHSREIQAQAEKRIN